MERNSQKTKILSLLDSGKWVCSSKFYALYIADPRKRLHELKQAGYVLESRWCKDHPHEGLQKQWRLIATPGDYVKPEAESDVVREFRMEFENRKRPEVKQLNGQQGLFA